MTANEILALRPRIQRFLRLFDDCFLNETTRHHLHVYVRGQLSKDLISAPCLFRWGFAE